MSKEITSRHPHLQKAPIREAVLEFMIEPLIEIEAKDEHRAKILIGNAYANAEVVTLQSFGFAFRFEGGVGSADVSQGLPFGGFLFKDEGRGFIVQIRRERIAISKLGPYEDFGQLKSEAISILNKVAHDFAIQRVNRIGLRYINDIEVKQPLAWYLRHYADFAGSSVTSRTEQHRYEYAHGNSGERTVVQIATEQVANQKQQLTIDIDTSVLDSLPSTDDFGLNEAIEILHVRKNDFFFGIVSEAFLGECK